MPLPDDSEEFRAALLEAVFEHYGLTYPNGYGERTVLCPVHDESVKSCSVNTLTGLWKCYACNAGGDAYNLIMDKEGIGYRDAAVLAQSILDRSGVEVHAGTGRKSRSGVSGKSRNRSGRSVYRPSWLRSDT